MAKIYLATLTRNLMIDVPFESIDAQTGQRFTQYTVQSQLIAGQRRFKTQTKCKAWVAHMNEIYGKGTAHMGANVA